MSLALSLAWKSTEQMKFPAPWNLHPDGGRQCIIAIEAEHLPKAGNAAVLCLLFCDLHTRASALHPFGLWLYCLID